MEYYENDTLKKLQRIELMIFKDFDDFCLANEISYAIIGGTAIGAVRHGGFIPWDDDIDVMMDIKNYKKFIILAKEKMCDKYYILNRETDPHVPVMNTHLCLKGTEFRTSDQYNVKKTGIFLDIFCFDNLPDDEDKMRWQWKKAWTWGKLMTLAEIKNPVIMCHGLKKKIIASALKISHYFLNIIGLTPDRCYKKALHYRSLYNDKETNRIGYFFDTSLFMELCERRDFFPTKRMKYENIMVNAPNNIDKYLSDAYGDFMTLPPEEKRHNHKPDVLDFGKYIDL